MTNQQFTPPGQTGPQDTGGPRVTRDDLRDPSRLRRVVEGRKIGGVAGGLARYFDVDPVIVRVAFAVTGFFFVGILVYAALWVVVPEDGSTDRPLGLDDRNRGYLLLGIAGLAALMLLGTPWGWTDVPFPLILVGLVVALVLSQRTRRETPPPPPWGQYGNGPVMPGAPVTDSPTTAPQQAPTVGQVWNGSAWVPPGVAAATSVPSAPAASAGSSGLGGSGGSGSGGWQYTQGSHGPGQYWVAPTVPAPPRKRGPLLFWWTMLLMTLSVATLWLMDVTGTRAGLSAYPAIALACVGLMLLVGAFWGRAGGLVLVGLLLLPVLGLARAAEVVEDERTLWAPTSAAEVQDSYHRNLGRVVLDLSRLDTTALEGRTIRVSVNVGDVELIMPAQASWDVEGSVGLGALTMDDQELEGPGLTYTTSNARGDSTTSFSVQAESDLGRVTLRRAGPGAPTDGATDRPSDGVADPAAPAADPAAARYLTPSAGGAFAAAAPSSEGTAR